jgi:ribose transport system ATP-binding protein
VSPSDSSQLLASLRGVEKSFGAVRALRGVSFHIAAGETVGLVGANGAGKSTLIKMIAGLVKADAGEVLVDGELLGSPRDAVQRGVAVVPQELQLIEGETVAHNVFLGRLPATVGILRRRDLNARAREVLSRAGLGPEVDPRQSAGSLTSVQQRLLSIAQALSANPKLLVLDEPSAALPADTAEILGPIIRQLSESGTGVIYISHRLHEVAAFTERVVVMRDGQLAGELLSQERTRERMIELMGGGAIKDEPMPVTERTHSSGETIRATGLSGRRVREANLVLRPGELVGLGGLYGSGRSELLRLLAGLQRASAGEVEFMGKRGPRSAHQAAKQGIGYVPEDRRRMIFPTMDVVANTTISALGRLSRSRMWINRRRELEAFENMAERTGLVGQPDAAMRSLSGGNQQKVCVARWLINEPRLLLLDEPTVGVAVHARAEIHKLLRTLAESGTAILVACAEPEELVLLCERVLILVEGEIVAELRAPFDPNTVVSASYGRQAA